MFVPGVTLPCKICGAGPKALAHSDEGMRKLSLYQLCPEVMRHDYTPIEEHGAVSVTAHE